MLSSLSNMLAIYQNDIDVQHSLFSALFSITVICVAYMFRIEQWKLEYIAFLVSIPLSIFMCGWRARWNALQASVLGGIFTLSLLCAYSTSNFYLSIFAWYFACIAAFHYGEFLATALTNRTDLNFSSYLLDHSSAYWAAALISWVEYAVEVRFLPFLKNAAISYIGLILVIFGEILRKLAMVHANGGFTHMVAIERRPKHKLITDGVYSIVRHPGYLGWLIWCLGTQNILGRALSNLFFGAEYIQYQKTVPLGIPLIKGYESR
ncbi:Protein-S-isoprenylcysteine O-methyltransferase [Dirofilaria immitis]|nr:Protein-S-isoprenylcysteine O-methyltransferase [Dirofilaria immitis]